MFKKTLISLLITGSLVLLFFVQSTQAQESGFTFPLKINGISCASKAECKVLCDDPVNLVACQELKKSKGEGTLEEKFADPSFVTAVTAALGCSTFEDCRTFCSDEANVGVCTEFAQQNGIAGGKEKTEPDPERAQLLDDLAKELGLESRQDLKQFCDAKENQQLCSKIARKLGLRGGLKMNGPGGCTNATTCRAYCDDPSNFDECQEKSIEGINGCTSQLSCFAEAQENPEQLAELNFGAKEDQLKCEGTADLEGLCSSFVSTFNEARTVCSDSTATRPTWMSDEQADARFCLSAPKNWKTYAEFCESNTSECTSNGYDAFCKQNNSECQPLFQGTPISRVLEGFKKAEQTETASGSAVVLIRPLKDFAAEILPKTNLLTTELRQTTTRLVSREEVASAEAKRVEKRQWFDLTASTKSIDRPTRSTTPAAGENPGLWNQIRQKYELEKEVVRERVKEEEQRIEQRTPLQPGQEPIDQLERPADGTRLPAPTFKPESSSGTGTSTSSKTPTPIKEPTKLPTSGSGTSGSNTGTTTSPNLAEPTKIPEPTSFNPNTSTSTQQSGTTTGSTTTGGTTTNTTSQTVSPSPRVEGARTEQSLVQILWEQLRVWF